MQRLTNCEFIIDIQEIVHISSAGQFEILVLTTDQERYKFIFKNVWDMRLSMEIVNVNRFCEFRKCLPDGIIYNGIYVVEDSDYVKYWEIESAGAYGPVRLTHYLVQDNSDLLVDILVCGKGPVLVLDTDNT